MMMATTLSPAALCSRNLYLRSSVRRYDENAGVFMGRLKLVCYSSSALVNDAKVGLSKLDDVLVTWEDDGAADCPGTVLTLAVRQGLDIFKVASEALKGLGLRMLEASVKFDGSEDGEYDKLEFVMRNSDGELIVETDERKRIAGHVVDVLRQETVNSRKDLLHKLMDQYAKNDTFSIQKSIVDHVEYTLARSRFQFDDFEAYQATAYSVRDRLIERWNDTNITIKRKDPKRLYYMSMEFLMGRSLLNSIYNIGVKGQFGNALKLLGFDLEVLVEQERDAALGNGGLGRLAACFLDSLATLDYPAWGYGLRYEYGLFRQSIQDGFQIEHPDYGLNFGNPWEIERVHTTYVVKYYGKVEESTGSKIWIPSEKVEAVAYDNPIPGYGTRNTINLRLWAAKPSGEFELQSFNTGDYVNAILSKQRAETISNILYPDDRTYQGKELRLKQQYFLVSASLQDVVRRFKGRHSDFEMFPDKVAFHLNDTHPIIGVVELMRILLDEEDLGWSKAWNITTKVFSFTNHATNSEALEKWPLELLESVLPRHLQIIYQINTVFMDDLKLRFLDDYGRLARMSIFEEGEKKNVRMANLALVSCHTINGVSEMHSKLIQEMFKDFYDLYPHKFQNKTNGVTQRRWLGCSNPLFSSLITKWLGTSAWAKRLGLLSGLKMHASNVTLQEEWMQVRRINKTRLAAYIEIISGEKVTVEAMFDVQVKRIHEYKRQFLNILSIIHRYDCIKNMKKEEQSKIVPRVCIIAGKASPGYETAKKIIKLVHAVGEKINKDPDVGHLLKLIFIPDYNVTLAELIIPASDLSQHIRWLLSKVDAKLCYSTPGSEASGTGVMKFAMNGCLILCTKDGANTEIRDEVGEENMFVFGVTVDEVKKLRAERNDFQPPMAFRRVIGMIRSGMFGDEDYFESLCNTVVEDHYLLGNDFIGYLEAQAAADKAYVNKRKWWEMSIQTSAGSANFSSDRAIESYARDIWDIRPYNSPT